MLVRIEPVRNSEEVVVIDEIDRFIGIVSSEFVFLGCTTSDKILEEDGYRYYYVSKKLLKEYINEITI